MRSIPALAKEANQAGIGIGIEGSLGKAEIYIWSFALRDQRRGDQMKAFIPNKCARLRVGNQGAGDESENRWREALCRYGRARSSTEHIRLQINLTA